MTTKNFNSEEEGCPVQGLLKLLVGKWKPQIFRIAMNESIRFSSLLRQLPNSNKQTLSIALKELEEAGLLIKTIINEKPLHIEYNLSEKGKSMISIFESLEVFMNE